MTPELGQIALILALLLSLAQSVLPLIGAWRGNTALMDIARPAAVGQAVFVWMAFGLLAWSLLSLDFSVGYVAANANIALPWYYRFAAVWGAHEGSLLLWIAILATWTVLLAAFSRHLPQHFAARVLAVLGLISVGFLAFILLTSNPFARLSPIPLDGNELNPVLQDPGMTFHPPVLYTGYVGFSVAFAFAVAALLGGELEQAWVAGRDRGPMSPGPVSPPASSPVAGGPMRNWAGAAGGSGTRWKTPVSCHGWSVPH